MNKNELSGRNPHENQPASDTILSHMVSAFLGLVFGLAGGYAWAIHAYGINLVN